MQKARRHPGYTMGLRPLVGTRFQNLFHSPRRGSFHISLALLFAIGHQGVLSLARWSALLHARFHGSGATRDLRLESTVFRLQDYHLLWPAFPDGSAKQWIGNSIALLLKCWQIPQPPHCNASRLTQHGFGLVPFRSPLLGESMSLSFPAGTEMGQFPAFPTQHYGFMPRSRGASSCRFRISDTPGSTPAYGS